MAIICIFTIFIISKSIKVPYLILFRKKNLNKVYQACTIYVPNTTKDLNKLC